MQTRAKRALIVAFDEVDLLDLAAPITALSRAGRRWNFRPFHVEVAAVTPGAIQSRDQLRFEAPLVLSAVAPAEIVIVPGGYGARRAADDPAVTVELARVSAKAELVAGIGWGVLVLAQAGLIGDRRVASGPELEPLLRARCPGAVCDASLEPVFDAPLLTARGGGGALSLGLEIVERSFGKKLRALLEADLCLAGPERLEIVGSLPSLTKTEP
jgi:transcriptional regulator GlxA family with amidase domain